MKGTVVAIATAGILAAVGACSSAATSQSVNTPPRTVTATVQPQTITQAPVIPHPAAPGTTAAHPATPTAPVTVTVTSTPLTNGAAVVQQYYQDINDRDYAAAWALGGRNIAGQSYAQYVAGLATTVSVSLGTVSVFGGDQVQAEVDAIQTNGRVKVFEGTYTVRDGVLVAADIRQVD